MTIELEAINKDSRRLLQKWDQLNQLNDSKRVSQTSSEKAKQVSSQPSTQYDEAVVSAASAYHHNEVLGFGHDATGTESEKGPIESTRRSSSNTEQSSRNNLSKQAAVSTVTVATSQSVRNSSAVAARTTGLEQATKIKADDKNTQSPQKPGKEANIGLIMRLFRGLVSTLAVSQASQGAQIDLAYIRSPSSSRIEKIGLLLDSQQGDPHKPYLDVFNRDQGMGSSPYLTADFSNGFNQGYFGDFFHMDVEQDENRLESHIDDAEETIDTVAANIIAQNSVIAPIVKTHGELAKLFFFNGVSTTQLLAKEFKISESDISQFFKQNLKVWGEATDSRGNVDVVALASGLKGLSGFDQRLYTENNLVRLENMVTQSAEVARKQIDLFRIVYAMKAYQLVQSQQGQASQPEALKSLAQNAIITGNQGGLSMLVKNVVPYTQSVKKGNIPEYQGGPDFFTTIWHEFPEKEKQQLVKSVGNEQDWETLCRDLMSLLPRDRKQVDSQRAPGFEVSELTEKNVEKHNELNTSRLSSDGRRGSLSQATTVPASHSMTHTQSAESHNSGYEGDEHSALSDESVISPRHSSSNSSRNSLGSSFAFIGKGAQGPDDEEGWEVLKHMIFAYHYTDKDGNPREDSLRDQNLCHDLSVDANNRSNSSESSQQSLKYHTVSVEWNEDDTPKQAGESCMMEYLCVMGLQRGEEAQPTNPLAVIELLEKEWVPEGSKDASSGQNIDARLAALFEEIPINAHPDQRESFREGAREVFMDTLRLALDANYQNNQTRTNRGVVGGQSRPNRLDFSRWSLQEKIQESSESPSKPKSRIDPSSSYDAALNSGKDRLNPGR